MADQLVNPADAVPQSTAAALSALDPAGLGGSLALDLVSASMSTSARAALATADVLRQATNDDAVRFGHLVLGAWADDRGYLRRSAERAGIRDDALREALANAKLDPAAVDLVPRARLEASSRVRGSSSGGTELPPLDADSAAVLQAAADIAGLSVTTGARRDSVHARHLVAGLFAAPAGPFAELLGAIRPEADRTLREAVEQEIAASRLVPDEAARQQSVVDRLWGVPSVAAKVAEAPIEKGTPATSDTEPAASAVGTGGGAINDRADGDDRLGFAHYVTAFANLIDSADTQPPLTIGIYGAWGAGKSFLLGHLTRTLDRRAAARRLTRARRFGRWMRKHVARLRGHAVTRERLPARVITVQFNAWEYNAAEQIWPRLVRRVLDTVERDIRWHRTPLRWLRKTRRKLRRSFGRKLRADWRSIATLAAAGAALGWVLVAVPATSRWSVLAFLSGKGLTVDKVTLPALLAALGGIGKLLVDSIVTPLGSWVTALFDDGRGYGGDSDLVQAIHWDLGLLSSHLLDADDRVLIIIDDLDRCEPQKAVEVLQSINLLLNSSQFVVCLGIDARVITAAIEKHYEDLLGPAGITGYEYLDKIIQIPFRIPEPTPADLANFMSKQLGDPVPGRAGHGTLGRTRRDEEPPSTPDAAGDADTAEGIARAMLGGALGTVVDAVAPGTRAALVATATVADELLAAPAESPDVTLSFTHEELLAFEAVAPFLRPNPRHVKRLVNVYALVRSLAVLSRNAIVLADPAATVRWLTLCAQWPYAARCMLMHLDANGPPDGAGNGAPSPLRQLHAAVSPSLDPAKQARFDHDARSLDRLVASSDGLSWEELRVLRAYTVNFNPALDSELRVLPAARPKPKSGAGHRRNTPPE